MNLLDLSYARFLLKDVDSSNRDLLLYSLVFLALSLSMVEPMLKVNFINDHDGLMFLFTPLLQWRSRRMVFHNRCAMFRQYLLAEEHGHYENYNSV